MSEVTIHTPNGTVYIDEIPRFNQFKFHMTHIETLKEELKALEETAEKLTSDAGTIAFKQAFNKKRIKLVKEEIAAAEQIETSVETLAKITEKE